ncbi:hypothetical protein GCM10027093_09460 [Paraburkholderia jirisanensis]
MREYRAITAQTVAAYVCDRCKRKHEPDDFEFHEFVSLEFVGGFESIFGDTSKVEIELCQHCLRETLGPWLRVTSMDERERARSRESDSESAVE